MRPYSVFLIFSLLLSTLAAPSFAQTVSGCTERTVTDPDRTVYECAGGVVLDAEAAAQLGLTTPSGQQRPDGAELESDAVLIEVDPGSGPFQIRTPHAIAAVRGTTYVVDVTADTTSVFVREGVVEVTRLDGSEPVLLEAGDGVDVTAQDPLIVRQWPQDRVNRLLSRFGR
ncbi:iron dicitrate transport regulator FecR [Roseibium denhamense]|uniref:FecR family protein n=1 Tax=Roseibium denhamense TaxID=76305 RepID=A0ABY1PHV8_9HYPH|nr:FecR family protein [Roseibium denhamense]MTI05586.1 iron dicitrate transport regulator FecR [Roseibium denhamense]SMP34567.1 FecR family protein [Roseibium denhamense]